jgi:hypothetical protein
LRQAVLSLRNAMKHNHPTNRAEDTTSEPVTPTGFFRMGVICAPLRSQKAWRWGIPLRQRKVVQTRGNQVDYAVRSVIKEALETTRGLLDTNPLPEAGREQIIAVTLPVTPDQLSKIVRSVKAILSREAWWQAHAPTTQLLFGSVNFTDPEVLHADEPQQSFGWFTRFLRVCFRLVTLVPRLLHRLVFGKNHHQ